MSIPVWVYVNGELSNNMSDDLRHGCIRRAPFTLRSSSEPWERTSAARLQPNLGHADQEIRRFLPRGEEQGGGCGVRQVALDEHGYWGSTSFRIQRVS